jgi:hypothetical protein
MKYHGKDEIKNAKAITTDATMDFRFAAREFAVVARECVRTQYNKKKTNSNSLRNCGRALCINLRA